jgi:hypothetical protein
VTTDDLRAAGARLYMDGEHDPVLRRCQLRMVGHQTLLGRAATTVAEREVALDAVEVALAAVGVVAGRGPASPQHRCTPARATMRAHEL